MILSDNETKVDQLNNMAIAKQLYPLSRIAANLFLLVFMETGVLANLAFLQ